MSRFQEFSPWHEIRRSACVLLVAACGAPVVQAHHSFVATYDCGKPIRVSGRLTQANWVNPHSTFVLQATGEDGRVSTWTFEGGSPVTLSRRGFHKDDLHVGDVLTIDGYAARSGRRLVDAQRMTLPDGRVFSVGTPGHGASDSGTPLSRRGGATAP